MHRYVRDKEIGARPIRQITTPEVYDLITGVATRPERKGMERRQTAPSLAILIRQWCSAVFRLAVISGRADRNPVADLKASDVIVKPKTKNNRALSTTELKSFLKALECFSGTRVTGIAIELLMLTFVRTKELIEATWDEFDLENMIWEIPASRMKIKDVGNHYVPLSPKVVGLLLELLKITGESKSGPRYLFRNTRQDARCMSATTINRALERMGFNGKNTIGFSGHGFRGTASTHLHELREADDVIETQLAHREGNTTKLAYNKAKYLPDRVKLMHRWANYITELQVSGDKV